MLAYSVLFYRRFRSSGLAFMLMFFACSSYVPVVAVESLRQIWAVQEALGSVTPNFSIAAAFGNVHGVYKPGNVQLNPGILATHQVRTEMNACRGR